MRLWPGDAPSRRHPFVSSSHETMVLLRVFIDGCRIVEDI